MELGAYSSIIYLRYYTADGILYEVSDYMEVHVKPRISKVFKRLIHDCHREGKMDTSMRWAQEQTFQ